MTTETINIEALEQAVSEAQKALDVANKEAAEKSAPILAVQPIDFAALSAISRPVQVATDKLESARKALSEGKAADRWESSIAVRQPVLDAIDATILDNRPSVKVLGVTGRIEIDADGKVSVNLTPQIGKLDMADIEALVAEAVNVPEFQKVEILSVDVSVTGLDGQSPVISLKPTASGRARSVASNPDAPRAGALEYNYKGEWLGAREFLTAVEAAGEQIATDRKQSFETALRGNGNGLSNTAKQVAAKLNAESRTREA